MAAQFPRSLGQASRVRALLIQAGCPEYRYFILYLGIRVLFAAVGFASVLLISRLTAPPLLAVVTVMGLCVPHFILKMMIRSRQKRIRLSLIDALDLIALCVEAGTVPIRAMKQVAEDLRHMRPELSDELYLVWCEMRAGYSWDEALRSMSERTGVGEIEELSELIRAEPLGVIRNLQTCADSLRVECSQRAKAKTMVPALVVFGAVFILPVILVVILGPALIVLYRTLIS